MSGFWTDGDCNQCGRSGLTLTVEEDGRFTYRCELCGWRRPEPIKDEERPRREADELVQYPTPKPTTCGREVGPGLFCEAPLRGPAARGETPGVLLLRFACEHEPRQVELPRCGVCGGLPAVRLAPVSWRFTIADVAASWVTDWPCGHNQPVS